MMTKDVVVTVSGLQTLQMESSDPIEVITSGEYYYKNGKHYILYDEVMEGFDEVTKNRIKIDGERVSIHREGVTNTMIEFEKDKKTMSYYQTPFGSILLGIDPSVCQVEEHEDAIDVNILYDLEVNSQHLAECAIRMNFKSRKKC